MFSRLVFVAAFVAEEVRKHEVGMKCTAAVLSLD